MERGARALSRGAAELIRNAYGFADVSIGDRLQGGYANDLFRVRADGRQVVLRVKHPPVDDADIAWEHRMTRLLADRLREVSAPLETRDGATFVVVEDRVAWLVPFVDASPADPAREAHRLAAARALGRLHRAGTEVALPPRPRLRPLRALAWPPPAVPPELEPWGETIAEERAWAIAYVAGVAAGRRLETSIVHGDFFPGNVLVSGDEAVAVVDWEEAQADWLVWDLAIAVGTFCGVGDRLDRDACDAFVAAYRAAGGPVSPPDDDLLLPLVRVKRVLEVLRAPTDRDPRWELQRSNLRSLEHLPRRA